MDETALRELNHNLARQKREVEAALYELLPPEDAFPPRIHAAMRYGVMNGGKRLRPILVREACRIGGGDDAAALPVACALEMIHSYSLVHDDLPCMDDDHFRRGVPTCHIAFDEATAVLAGDALLTCAFHTVAAAELPAILKADIIRELSVAAGSRGMIGGQILDLEAEERVVSLDELRQIHALKTGALFRAALRCGGMVAGMDADSMAAVDDYAAHFGMAFQITDDILDVAGEEAVLGKPVGSDARNQKNTYMSFFSLPQAQQLAADEVLACLKALDRFGPEADILRTLAEYLLTRNS
ncbi:MAG: polyprenyl synthetase family protein [Syntrophomonadaceae bacterium]|nr:polyprenyl synthetase family protein [Syntrophomonadaceae bacterium]